jgi:O-succinylbenzoate synthase
MMNFWFHKYQLQAMPTGSSESATPAVEGALLKVGWPDGRVGYADLCPLLSFGDADIDTQLEALAKGRLSPLLEQSIWLAKRDATLRKEGKSAFSNVVKVKNHFLVTDMFQFSNAQMAQVRSAGFTTLKLKVGNDPEEEVKIISRWLKQNPVMLRLDFNSKLKIDDYQVFMLSLSQGERARIEFVEDPFPWHPEAWRAAALFAPLALDFEAEKINWETLRAPVPFKIMVIKPARMDIEKSVKRVNQFGLKMVVTSSMDHPVGIAHALHVASELKKFNPNTLLDCGCLTLRVYKPNEFSNAIQVTGPYLAGIKGTGIGFDDLLQGLPWISLKK